TCPNAITRSTGTRRTHSDRSPWTGKTGARSGVDCCNATTAAAPFHIPAVSAIDSPSGLLVALPKKSRELSIASFQAAKWGEELNMDRLRVLPALARSASVLALASCFVSATATSAQETPVEDEIIVTGVRASLEAAMDIKREASGVVD